MCAQHLCKEWALLVLAAGARDPSTPSAWLASTHFSSACKPVRGGLLLAAWGEGLDLIDLALVGGHRWGLERVLPRPWGQHLQILWRGIPLGSAIQLWRLSWRALIGRGVAAGVVQPRQAGVRQQLQGEVGVAGALLLRLCPAGEEQQRGRRWSTQRRRVGTVVALCSGQGWPMWAVHGQACKRKTASGHDHSGCSGRSKRSAPVQPGPVLCLMINHARLAHDARL